MAIQSVERALKILTLFSFRTPMLGVTEISQALALSKGTVHGLIRTLLAQGFLQQDRATRKYRLGLKIYELGNILAGSLEINQKAAGPAQLLAKTTQCPCRVAIWDNDSVIITSEMHFRTRGILPHYFGPRVHAYCSAIGKAILAFMAPRALAAYLSKVQFEAFTPATFTRPKQLQADLKLTVKRGYAIDREEAVPGLGCIAAPIFAGDGQVAGSISISGSIQKMLGERSEFYAEELLKTAREISNFMGYYPAFADSASSTPVSIT